MAAINVSLTMVSQSSLAIRKKATITIRTIHKVDQRWRRSAIFCLLRKHSYSFYLSRAEDAVGPDEQYKYHDEVGCDLVKARAQEVGEATFIARSQYFGQADNDPTQNCSAQRI